MFNDYFKNKDIYRLLINYLQIHIIMNSNTIKPGDNAARIVSDVDVQCKEQTNEILSRPLTRCLTPRPQLGGLCARIFARSLPSRGHGYHELNLPYEAAE